MSEIIDIAMPSFSFGDAHGRRWSISFDLATINRILDRANAIRKTSGKPAHPPSAESVREILFSSANSTYFRQWNVMAAIALQMMAAGIGPKEFLADSLPVAVLDEADKAFKKAFNSRWPDKKQKFAAWFRSTYGAEN